MIRFDPFLVQGNVFRLRIKPFQTILQRRLTQRNVLNGTPEPTITQLTPITNAAYLHYPVTYLICTNDQAVSMVVQEMMVEGCVKAAADVRREVCEVSYASPR